MSKPQGLTQKDKDILFAVKGTAEKYHMTNDQVNQRRYSIKKILNTHHISMDAAKKLPILPPEQAAQGVAPPKYVKSASLPPVPVDEFDGLFQIETAPPPLPLSGDQQKERAMVKIKQMANDCPVDGAILIPSKYRATAMKMLAQEFAGMKWRVFPIKDNEAQIRIYKTNFPSK